jgi:hypothetical protein
MCKYVFDDAVRQAPLDEVELGHGRREPLEVYALRSAKGIEELLGIAVKTRLVGDMHRKGAPEPSRVRDVAILCVVGDEPLQIPQRNTLTLCRQDVPKAL